MALVLESQINEVIKEATTSDSHEADHDVDQTRTDLTEALPFNKRQIPSDNTIYRLDAWDTNQVPFATIKEIRLTFTKEVRVWVGLNSETGVLLTPATDLKAVLAFTCTITRSATVGIWVRNNSGAVCEVSGFIAR